MLNGQVFRESNLVGDLAGCSIELPHVLFRCVPQEAQRRGKPVTEVQDDYFAKRRGPTPHIGALEFDELP